MTKSNDIIVSDNPSGISNCIIAIDIADRMKANELMVMQNLSIIQGRPSWSSQWVIAMINGCGKFSSLRFKVEDLGEKSVDYIEYGWEGKQQVEIVKKIKVHNFSCIAYATEKATGEVLESAKVTIEMAVKEGWYTKKGSKWQTMPEVMLRYRSASFFGSIYAPELKMGLQTVEESEDMPPVDLSPKYPNAIEPADTPIAKPAITLTPKSQPEPETAVVPDITDISSEIDDFEIPADVLAQAEAMAE
jgi:hypothetical protein